MATIFANSQLRTAPEVPRILVPLSDVSRTGESHAKAERAFPSWLTSLVLHLVSFLTLMTITGQPHGVTGSSAIVLTMSLGDAKEDESIVNLPESHSQPQENDSLDQPKGHADAILPPAPQQASAKSTEENESAKRTVRKPMMLPLVPNSKYAALQPRRKSRSNHRAPFTTSVVHKPMDRNDMVVERFIQYDIGKLRGAEGVRARQEFSQLGPEAFPALIRGLNRSAAIHASCPVGVIAGKILHVLRSTDDPSLAAYAAEHIGDGVPETAPHYRRIMALRDQYIGGPEVLTHRVSEMLEQRGMAGKGETFELALGLAERPAATLLAALQSNDEDLVLPATIALMQRLRNLKTNEKRRAYRLLAAKNLNEFSPDYRLLANDALRAIEANLKLRRDNRLGPPARRGVPLTYPSPSGFGAQPQ